MVYLMVLAGFVLLLGGAEFLVRGAVALARGWGVSTLVIGMTVVALGTSAPELIVSLDAALSGAGGLAVGNLVGSNIANVLLILGAACLVRAVTPRRGAMTRDSLVLALGTAAFVGIALTGHIGRLEGLALLAGFLVFLGLSYAGRKGSPDPELAQEVADLEALPSRPLVTWSATLGGLAALLAGAHLLVDGGVEIARTFGVPEEVIGLTLIALGTSLPELAASVMAALRGHADVALGNVVGSNIFNLLAVGGTVAAVAPLPVADQILGFDLWVMAGATLFLLPFLVWGRTIGRGWGLGLLLAYGAYIALVAGTLS